MVSRATPGKKSDGAESLLRACRVALTSKETTACQDPSALIDQFASARQEYLSQDRTCICYQRSSTRKSSSRQVVKTSCATTTFGTLCRGNSDRAQPKLDGIRQYYGSAPREPFARQGKTRPCLLNSSRYCMPHTLDEHTRINRRRRLSGQGVCGTSRPRNIPGGTRDRNPAQDRGHFFSKTHWTDINHPLQVVGGGCGWGAWFRAKKSRRSATSRACRSWMS